jgi:hypothetical protein
MEAIARSKQKFKINKYEIEKSCSLGAYVNMQGFG